MCIYVCGTLVCLLVVICKFAYTDFSDGENEVSVSDSSLLKPSGIDSQSSETDLDGTLGEGKGRTKKKKNRQHKKKQWAAILRDMNLRVISK